MKTYSKLLMLGLVLSLVISSCYNDNKEDIYSKQPKIDCNTSNVSYKNEIQVIFNNNCTSGCHSGPTPAQGLDLTDYTQAMAKANRIVERINGTDGIMPPGGSLPDCEITQIEIWVQDGAPNN